MTGRRGFLAALLALPVVLKARLAPPSPAPLKPFRVVGPWRGLDTLTDDGTLSGQVYDWTPDGAIEELVRESRLRHELLGTPDPPRVSWGIKR